MSRRGRRDRERRARRTGVPVPPAGQDDAGAAATGERAMPERDERAVVGGVQERRASAAARRRGAARRSRIRRLLFQGAVGGLAIVAVALALNALGVFRPAVGESIPDLGRGHLAEGQSGRYNSIPPTSGAHAPPVRWGSFSARIPDENVVHNLEHGGIAIAYNGIPAEDVQRLQGWLTSYPRDRFGSVKIVIHPDERLPAGTIALTAWTRLLKLTAYDESQVRAFLDANMDRCCESVRP